MVSVCAGCDGFEPWAGLLIGIIAGVLYVLFSKMMTLLEIDDPLDAVAVHMGSGFWGLVAAPLLLPDGQTGTETTSYLASKYFRNCLHWLHHLPDEAGLEHGGGRGLHRLADGLRDPHVWLPQGQSWLRSVNV